MEEIGAKQEQRKRRLELKKELLKSIECSKCHNPIEELLQSADAEPHRIDGEQVCKKCYFAELGEEIEKHPIGLPRRTKVF